MLLALLSAGTVSTPSGVEQELSNGPKATESVQQHNSHTNNIAAEHEKAIAVGHTSIFCLLVLNTEHTGLLALFV